MTTMETSKFRKRYVWYKKNRRHPYAALKKIIKKFCNKLMVLDICLNEKIWTMTTGRIHGEVPR